MTGETDEELSHSEYWDERYSKSDGAAPTHEWFRSFSDLEPFFQKNLFEVDRLKPSDNLRILHLGSGDSVRRPIPYFLASLVVASLTSHRSRLFQLNWRLGATINSSASTSLPLSLTL